MSVRYEDFQSLEEKEVFVKANGLTAYTDLAVDFIQRGAPKPAKPSIVANQKSALKTAQNRHD